MDHPGQDQRVGGNPLTVSCSKPDAHFSAFDEEKCRNVLVRFCAHIPRNYPYRDGIGLIFLLLRDHLGDENLGQAGGVLYELIELDCDHSDDPGATFQRWRHAHMNRYDDLELPHIPHLTTIATPIVPTVTLEKWRQKHPERYQIKLSDHAPIAGRERSSSGSIRGRKDWMIETTMYVSTREEGTRPYRRIEAQDFHESQWNYNPPQTGKWVGERSVDLAGNSSANIVNVSNDAPNVKRKSVPLARSVLSGTFRKHLRSMSRPDDLISKYIRFPSSRTPQNVEPETMPESPPPTPTTDCAEQGGAPPMDGWEIPNANFARKFSIVTDEKQLPISIKELPVAEDRAAEYAGAANMRQKIHRGSPGPLTPQLWYDSGLEYRWKTV